jgi:hypothetical protein
MAALQCVLPFPVTWRDGQPLNSSSKREVADDKVR